MTRPEGRRKGLTILNNHAPFESSKRRDVLVRIQAIRMNSVCETEVEFVTEAIVFGFLPP